MLIAIINKSTMVSDQDINTMCQAIDMQVKQHVLPAYNMSNGSVQFFANTADIPKGAWRVMIIDDDTQVEGALGYHIEDNNSGIDGYVMCKPILENGGAVMKYDASQPAQYTVSATLSHEVLEMIGDPYTSCWYDNDAMGITVCSEIADPCEQISYSLKVGSINVAVSDFVLPAFFDQNNKTGPFNYLHTITKPFDMLEGGYTLIRQSGEIGTEQQVFGAKMPEWRKACKQKSFARTTRQMKKST